MLTARLGAKMDSLLLSCTTLSFATTCRFIPAHPVIRRSRQHQPDSAGAASRRAKGLLHRLGVLCNDHKEGARRPFRLPVTLFPVLNRIQRETKFRGKLSLTQSHPGTQFSHVHLWRRDVGDTHADRLAPYPAS